MAGCAAMLVASVGLLTGPAAAQAAPAGPAVAQAAPASHASSSPEVGSSPVLIGASGSPETAFKSHCSAHLTYKQLARASAHAPGRCVDERGQVFQYRPGNGGRSMLLDVTDTGGGIWDTAVEVRLPASSGLGSLYQDDIVEVWGRVAGSATARTRFGGSIHVPVVDAHYMTVLQSIASSVTTPGAT
jgi:hypothetical protein